MTQVYVYCGRATASDWCYAKPVSTYVGTADSLVANLDIHSVRIRRGHCRRQSGSGTVEEEFPRRTADVGTYVTYCAYICA